MALKGVAGLDGIASIRKRFHFHCVLSTDTSIESKELVRYKCGECYVMYIRR